MSEAIASVDETPRPKETRAHRRMREETDLDAYEYMKNLSEGSSIKVTVVRKSPSIYKGHDLKGTIESFEDPITEEEIKAKYGGGKYLLKIQTPNEKGSWEFAGNKTIEISGPPNIQHLVLDDTKEDSKVVSQAMRTMQELVADKDKGDPAMLALVDGLQNQMGQLQQTIAEKDKQVLELIGKKGEPGTTDLLLGKMLENESAQIAAIRVQHGSEISAMRERYTGELNSQRSSSNEQLARLDTAHDRELGNLKSNYEAQTIAIGLAHKTATSGLEREIRSLERELEKSNTELAALRAKKDKSVVDTITEITTVREALDGFGGGDSAGASTLDKIAGIVAPIIDGVSARIAEPGAQPPQQQQQAEPEMPFNQPVHMPDGRIIVRKPDPRNPKGKFMEIRRKKKIAVPVAGDTPLQLDPEEVRQSITFMENAQRSGTTAKEFTASARTFIPPTILKALSVQGIDPFLNKVADLEPGSPLATQEGRNWMRDVATILVEGD